MADTLQKLRPDRDLQCYFQEPSAIAAMSGASPNGYTVSGTWRQQFDWAVIEWNRDNRFEHPIFRSLPDGDLSGLTLQYSETRTNCIPMESSLFATVDWPSLRVWTDPDDGQEPHKIPLKNYAVATQGSYVAATASLTLQGTPTGADFVGFAIPGEHYTYQMLGADSLTNAINALVAAVNAFSPTMTATQVTGTTITLAMRDPTTGTGGNRIGVYTFTSGANTEHWNVASVQMSGGLSPTQWQVTLPFATIKDSNGNTIAANSIRKMRWTYSADLQTGAYQRSEFQVVVSNWTVTGANRAYSIAGPGSRRIENDAPDIHYSGNWAPFAVGNYSGGTIKYTNTTPASFACTYNAGQTHNLYLGTRLTFNGGTISVVVDSGTPATKNLFLAGEDTLARLSLGQFGAGSHTVQITFTGAAATYFYFDFLEIAIPTQTLPVPSTEPVFTLATDWDTEHSLALPAERTAWMINSLGFKGRVNHYAGALWFYELVAPAQHYASTTITFTGSPDPNLITQILIGQVGQPVSTWTPVNHLNLIGDTTTTLATAFAILLNGGYTGVRAQATGNQLTIFARAMGTVGNQIAVGVSANTTHLTITLASAALTGGVDPVWLTDLAATPSLNRAARDWHTAFFTALKGYGLDAVAAFSMELGNGDPSVAAGIAQRYPDGTPTLLNTPSLQTNFSPTSLAYWQKVYHDMAALQVAAGLVPYVQFGEVQWWYFPNTSGMPFYDAYTTSTFQTTFGHPMSVITSNTVNPALVPNEASFLPGLIGNFTQAVIAFVKTAFSNCRFEVLYPRDVNNFPLTKVINYPTTAWTPANLTALKTESFGFTFERDLNLSLYSMLGADLPAFGQTKRSHLVGISDSSTSWLKEARLAQSNGFESVVLFALDQFCLVGYGLPLSPGLRRSSQFG